ncbi:MAG: hypothetical protein ACOYB1_18750 [Limnohabitans sp.]
MSRRVAGIGGLMVGYKKVRIEMKRTLSPIEIPNGTRGYMAESKRGVRGLRLAKFDTGFYAFVYRAEIKEIRE